MDKLTSHRFRQKAGEVRLLCICGKPLANPVHDVGSTHQIKGVATPTKVG